MPGVTREQIDAAKQMTAIEFLQKHRPGELVKSDSRGEFELREHHSFKINGETSLWHWKSRDIGGKTALDFLVHVEGMKFVDAVLELCEENPRYIPVPPCRQEQKKEFSLPPAAANNRRVFAYLLKRGIDRRVIEACIRAGILYESSDYHNAVFVGRDETHSARYAFLRGTYTKSSKSFKMEQEGSDKAFCFCIPPRGQSKRVALYEAAIDALAHLTLEGVSDKYRLSLGGIYAPKVGETTRRFKAPAALTAFLARHPEIEEIEICTDNDHAGRWAADHIGREYRNKYRIIKNLPEIEGCDYGNLAEEKQKEQAARQRAACSR